MILNKKEYKDALNKIVVSDELKSKIMHKYSSENRKKTNVCIYKKFYQIAGIAACFVICLISYYAMNHYAHFSDRVTSTATPAPMQTQSPAANSDSSNSAATSAPQASETPRGNDHDVTSSPKSQRHSTNHSSAMVASSAETSTPAMTANASENYSAENNSENTDGMSAEAITSQTDSSHLAGAADADRNHDLPLATPPNDETDFPDKVPSLSAAVYTEKEVASVTEIEQELGYPIQVPHYIPEGYQTESVSLLFGEIVEISYTDGARVIYFRTAKSSEDISGDYTVYCDQQKIVIDDMDITIRGNDALYCNAAWFTGDDAFSIYSRIGVEKDTLIDMVASVCFVDDAAR